MTRSNEPSEYVRKVMTKTPDTILALADTYEDEKRILQKKFRLTERENYLLHYKMTQAGIPNFSLYARHMLLNGMTVHTDFSDMRRLIQELSKIGTNINQLAYKANQTNHIQAEDFETLRREHQQLACLVEEALLYKLKRARKGQGVE